MEKSIFDLVIEAEDNDKNGVVDIGKYVKHNLRETLDTIDAYYSSQLKSGKIDSLGEEKPVFNIVKSLVNIWFRATDIDRKHIIIKASKENQKVLAFIGTLKLQEFMRKEDFGSFLNRWGHLLAKYGSAILKFVEKQDKLFCEVMPWSRMIVDPIDFENNIQIERIWLTPSELKKRKEYNPDQVKELLNSFETKETSDGKNKDLILLYEVHGEMPLSYLTKNNENTDVFTQQMHVVSLQKSKTDKDGYDKYTLFSGKESKSPFEITHLIEEEGRTLSIGAIEDSFEAQWMKNYSIYQIKKQLDLTSKMIVQTSSKRFVGQNYFNDFDGGDILIHDINQPLELLKNRADISALQAFGAEWQAISRELAGVSEAMMGEESKSGTPWRETEARLAESHSLFELMTENKGLALERILRKWIIPFLKKKMDTTDEISEILNEQQIKKIDGWFISQEVNKRVKRKVKDAILKGMLFTKEKQEFELASETERLKESLLQQGNQRFISPSKIPTKTWKKILKDLEWNVEINITSEYKNNQEAMVTLSTVLKTITSNPMILENPKAKYIFNKILELTTGVSSIELEDIDASTSHSTNNQQQMPLKSMVPKIGIDQSLAMQ